MKRYRREAVKQTTPTLARIEAQEARGFHMTRERAKLQAAAEARGKVGKK